MSVMCDDAGLAPTSHGVCLRCKVAHLHTSYCIHVQAATSWAGGGAAYCAPTCEPGCQASGDGLLVHVMSLQNDPFRPCRAGKRTDARSGKAGTQRSWGEGLATSTQSDNRSMVGGTRLSAFPSVPGHRVPCSCSGACAAGAQPGLRSPREKSAGIAHIFTGL